VTPGDCTSAYVMCQSPPFEEALIVEPDDDPIIGNAVIEDGSRGCYMWPPGDNGPELYR